MKILPLTDGREHLPRTSPRSGFLVQAALMVKPHTITLLSSCSEYRKPGSCLWAGGLLGPTIPTRTTFWTLPSRRTHSRTSDLFHKNLKHHYTSITKPVPHTYGYTQPSTYHAASYTKQPTIQPPLVPTTSKTLSLQIPNSTPSPSLPHSHQLQDALQIGHRILHQASTQSTPRAWRHRPPNH